MSKGNMCPERKKLSNMNTNRSELTSKNQNPTSPIAASRKNPSAKPNNSDTTKASQVVRLGHSGK